MYNQFFLKFIFLKVFGWAYKSVTLMSSYDHSHTCIILGLLPLSIFFLFLCVIWSYFQLYMGILDHVLEIYIKIKNVPDSIIFLLRELIFFQKAVRVRASHLYPVNDKGNWDWFSDRYVSHLLLLLVCCLLGSYLKAWKVYHNPLLWKPLNSYFDFQALWACEILLNF